MSRLPTLRDKIRDVIFETDTPAAKGFDLALIVAILVSVAVVVLSTMPAVADEPYKSIFYAIEWGFTALFTVEYITRLCVAKRPLKYALSFFGIVDLLSILPAFLGLVIPHGERLMIVRTMRILRIFRILKLTRYLTEAQALSEAFYVSRHKITIFLTTVLIIVLIASALMHIVEGGEEGSSFNSIPSAMYWTIITMTTVGYGDVTPSTPLGMLITSVLVLIGYSLIIVPTGILSAEITASRQQSDLARASSRVCPACKAAGHASQATFCADCGERLDNSSPSPTPPSIPSS